MAGDREPGGLTYVGHG